MHSKYLESINLYEFGAVSVNGGGRRQGPADAGGYAAAVAAAHLPAHSEDICNIILQCAGSAAGSCATASLRARPRLRH